MEIDHGANYAFNRQWTAVFAERDARGKVIHWVFQCGCSQEKTFDRKHFKDPYEAANLAREYHQCVE